MKIKCSECGSIYSMSSGRIKALAYSTFRCGKCGKKIKAAACPSCGKMYSVTYTRASSSRYSINCSACGSRFTENFAPENFSPEKIFPQEQIPVQKKNAQPQVPESSAEAGESAGFLSFKKIFCALKNSFRPSGLLFGAVGAAALSLCFFMRFLNSLSFRADHYGWKWAAVPAVLLTVYFFSAACIAAGTGGKLSIPAVIRLVAVRFPYIAGGALSTAAVFFGAFFLFTEVPVIAPGFFGLVFFAVYVLVLAWTAAAYSGFWFYPAYAVDSGSAGKMILGFFRFMKSRFFRAFTVSLLLSVLTGAGAGVISLFHLGLKLLTERLGTVYGFPVLADFSSSLSYGFRDVADFLYPLRLTGYFSGFSSGLPFWTAAVLSVLSLAGAAWLISWTVSLSCTAFDELKKGITGGQLLRMWIFLAAAGILCVLMISGMRKGLFVF